MTSSSAPVAQLDRALPSEGRSREFESRRARHEIKGLAELNFSVSRECPGEKPARSSLSAPVASPMARRGYSRRQLLANAAIAASRVDS